jgi:hypothetical protein
MTHVEVRPRKRKSDSTENLNGLINGSPIAASAKRIVSRPKIKMILSMLAWIMYVTCHSNNFSLTSYEGH